MLLLDFERHMQRCPKHLSSLGVSFVARKAGENRRGITSTFRGRIASGGGRGGKQLLNVRAYNTVHFESSHKVLFGAFRVGSLVSRSTGGNNVTV